MNEVTEQITDQSINFNSHNDTELGTMCN